MDIDGTVADLEHRRQFVRVPKGQKKDWPRFFDRMDLDTPIKPVVHMVNSLHTTGNRIIFCSGRNHRHMPVTRQWLYDNVGPWTRERPLYMRTDNDHRSDDIVKKELLDQIREAGFMPELAIDDRDRVVAMWRANGIMCSQVNEGDF